MAAALNSKFLRTREMIRRGLHILVPSALLVFAAAIKIADITDIQVIQNWVFDSYQRLKPRPYEDARVRIIDLDDETLAKMGQWPWPRTLVAKLVRRLAASGAKAIAFDIVFAEPDRTSPNQILPLWPDTPEWDSLKAKARGLPDHDEALAQTIAKAPVVLGSVLTDAANGAAPAVKAGFAGGGDSALSFVRAFRGAVVNLPELEKTATGNGSFNPLPEPDGIIRRVPLLMRLDKQLIPSLSAEALRVSRGEQTFAVKAAGASGETSFGEHTGISKVKIGSLVIPTDDESRVWIYFTSRAPGRTIPIWRIFEKGFDAGTLKDSICFIGTSAAGLKDQRATPLNPFLPGVQIHAELAEQAILQNFLYRPDWAPGLELLYLVVLGAGLIWLMQRLGAFAGAWIAAAAILAAVAFSWAAFTQFHWLLDPVFPALVVLLIYLSSSLISYLRSEAERRQVRGAFGLYLSPALVEELAKNPDKLKLGGEERDMTFHFCDIEGFTTISESFDPPGLTTFLNRFLTPMTDIIQSHRGTIDKYIGDCIMAFWNAPFDDAEHKKNACLAVLEMHEKLAELNAQRKAEAEATGKKFIPLRIRTGLNSGPCVVGNMGSNQRFGYSVLGDDVNLASRLEGANKFFHTHIMVSEATYQGAQGAVEGRELGRIRVVGKTVPIRVFELLAKKGALSSEWRRLLPVYEQGMACFASKSFEKAAACFQEVLKSFPKDGPATFYLQAAQDYCAIPPPDGWEAVFNLESK